jgi:hypothetical protein
VRRPLFNLTEAEKPPPAMHSPAAFEAGLNMSGVTLRVNGRPVVAVDASQTLIAAARPDWHPCRLRPPSVVRAGWWLRCQVSNLLVRQLPLPSSNHRRPGHARRSAAPHAAGLWPTPRAAVVTARLAW